MHMRIAVAGVLVAVVLLGAVLRLRGNDYLLPLQPEPDAHIPVQVSMLEERVEQPHGDKNFGKYPHLLAWATIAATDPPPPVQAPAQDSLEAHLVAAKDPMRRVRSVVGWLSLIVLPATWLLARRFLGAGGALVALGLVATSLISVHFAAQARPHAAAMGFGTLAVWACTRVARRGDLAAYVLASLAGALCLGTLQSGLALGFPFLVAHLIAARRAGGSPWLLGGRRAATLAIPTAAVALTLAALYPFLFADSGGDAARVALRGNLVDQAGHKLFLNQFNGRGFALLGRALLDWEPTLVLGTVLALVLAALRRPAAAAPRPAAASHPTATSHTVERADLAVLLAYVLPYLLVTGLYQRVYERFLLPLIPALAILTGWGLERLSGGRPGRLALLAAIVLVPPTLIAWRLTELRLAPCTQELAAQWLVDYAHPAQDRILVTRSLQLPLFETVASDEEELRSRRAPRPPYTRQHWSDYQRNVLGSARPRPAWNLVWMPVEDLRGMARRPADYVRSQVGDLLVAEIFAAGRVHRGLTRVHREFRREGELLARFTPYRSSFLGEHPMQFQDETSVRPAPFAWRVLQAERMGPVIEILRPR